MRLMQAVLTAVVSKGSPATRSNILKTALRPLNVNRKVTPLSSLMRSIVLRVKKIPRNILTNEGQQLVDLFIQNTYFKLLAKSWSWIVQEAYNEHEEILKKNKYTQGSRGLPSIWKGMQRYLSGQGFSFKENPYSDVSMPYVAETDMTRIFLGPAGWGDKVFSLLPMYRLSEDHSHWNSFGRRGVSDGGFAFDANDTVEGAIDTVLDKVEEVRQASLLRLNEGKVVNLGPIQKRFMPNELERMLSDLRRGQSFSILPSGFGTGYSFSTRRGNGYEPASRELSDLVGAPVYYTSFDHD